MSGSMSKIVFQQMARYRPLTVEAIAEQFGSLRQLAVCFEYAWVLWTCGVECLCLK